MTDKMPPFPSDYEETTEHPLLNMERTIAKRNRRIAYERARADAWEARCRAAVAELDAIQRVSAARVAIHNGKYATHHEDYEMWASKALAAIGPLPPPTPLPGEGE